MEMRVAYECSFLKSCVSSFAAVSSSAERGDAIHVYATENVSAYLLTLDQYVKLMAKIPFRIADNSSG